MLTYERIRNLCKEHKITITGLEKELGFARGSLCKVNTNKPSSERVQKIADYFNISIDELNGQNNKVYSLSAKDQRDIANDLNSIMQKLDNGEDGPVRYNGQEIDDNSRILLRNAIELGLTQLKTENKKLYNPTKNQK